MASWSMGGREQTKLRGRSATRSSFVRGNPAVATPVALVSRKALENDDMVVEVIKRFWSNFDLSAHNEASHDEYVRVQLLITRSLVGVFELSAAIEAAEAAWLEHSKFADGATFEGFKKFLFGIADRWVEGIEAHAYAGFINKMLQRLLEIDPPSTGRLMAYRMVSVHAGVEDTVEVPECPEAAKWTMLEDVYPYFLYDDAEWDRATAVMPSLGEYESLSAREVEESLDSLKAGDGDERICPSFATKMGCASMLQVKATGATVEMLMNLPKGAPRLTASLSLARVGEVSASASGPFSGFTNPALGGGDRTYDINADDKYNVDDEAGVAPPKIWVLAKVGGAELASSLADKLGLVDVSVTSSVEYCLAQGIDIGLPAPAAETELPEEELKLITSVFKKEDLAKDEGTGACAAADLVPAAAGAGFEWLLALAEGFAAKSTEEDPVTVSLDDVVAARKAELGEAVAAAFKAPLASVSVEVATAAVTARLTSAEAEHKGYVIGDCVAVDRVAGELKPSAVVTLTMSDEDVTVRKSGQRLDPTEPKLYTGPELDAIKATVAELSAVKKEADENAATEAASLATRKAAFVAEKTATVEEGEEFDAEATEEEWTALLEEEAAAAAEAAKAAAAEEEAPAEPEEGEEGAEAPPAPLSLEELEALLARLVVRDEDSEAGITKCLGDYDSAVITAINVLKEVNSVSIDGLAAPEVVFAQALYRLSVTPSIPVPVPVAIELPEEFAAEEADEAACKTWISETGAPGALFSTYGGAMLPGGDSWSSVYCPVALVTDGELKSGLAANCAVAAGKVYLFSSGAARDMFIANPRPYVNPAPKAPKGSQRFAIVGGPASGRATLASMLSDAFALPVVALPEGAAAEHEGTAAMELTGAYPTVGSLATVRPPPPEPEEPAEEAAAEEEAPAEGEEAAAEGEAAPAEEAAPAVEPQAPPPPEPLLADSQGWIICVDSAEALKLMVSLNIVPDKVIVLEAPAADEGEDPLASLREKFTNTIWQPAPPPAPGPEPVPEPAEGEEPTAVEEPPPPPTLDELSEAFTAALAALEEAAALVIKPGGDELEVVKIPACATIDAAWQALRVATDPFAASGAATTMPEPPAALEADEEGNVPEAEAHYVPYGSSGKFCPVCLSDGHLVLGKPEFIAKFNGKFFVCAGEAEQARFLAAPEAFISKTAEPTAPPVRIMVKGAPYSGKSAAVEFLQAEYMIPILVLRDELQTLLDANPKPPPQPPAPEPEPEPAAEGEEAPAEGEEAAPAEEEPAAVEEPEPVPLVWQDHVETYLAGPPAVAAGEEAAPALVLSDETFVEVVSMIVKGSVFKESGYIWDSTTDDSAEQLTLMHAAGLGPEALVCVDVTADSAFARAPAVEIPPQLEPEPAGVDEEGNEIPPPEVEPIDEEAIKAEYEAKIRAQVDGELEALAYVDEAAAACGISMPFVAPAEEGVGPPTCKVDGNGSKGKVLATVNEALYLHTANRGSIFADTRAVLTSTAGALLASGEASIGKFGTHCPVRLAHDMMRLPEPIDGFACTYRHHVYYCAGEEERTEFLSHPVKYVAQSPPVPEVNTCVAVVGPPCCGKSSVAARLARQLGVALVSPEAAVATAAAGNDALGEAIRAAGVPGDALTAGAVVAALGGYDCRHGWVLDGFPSTPAQAQLLETAGVVPSQVYELGLTQPAAFSRHAALLEAAWPVFTEPAAVADSAAAVASATVAVDEATNGAIEEDEEEATGGLKAAQASMDAFEPEMEDAPEPEEGAEKGEPMLVNAEEKATLEAALAEEQAKVDAAAATLAEAEAARGAVLDAAKVTERVELAAYFLALHSVYYADADVATAKGVVATKEAAVATAVGSWNDEDEEACTGLVAAQKAMDGFEPEMEDAPEPEEGEQAEPTLVNAEEKATLEAALAEEQAKVDAANMDVAAATAALEAAVAAAADCAVNVASERAALLADAEALQVLAFDKATADLAGLEMYCMTMHDNFYLLDGSKSKWWLYAKAAEISLENVKRRQLYLVDSAMGNPAPLYDLGVTPIELASRVGAAGLHCPVSLAKNKLLIDCSLKLDIAADYKGTVYGFASANALNTFIDAPSPFLSSLPELMPRKLGGLEMLQVRGGMGEPVALEGCCAVAITTGTAANQTVVQGSDLCMVEYDGQTYRMTTADTVQKFLKSPQTYFEADLPAFAVALNHGKNPPIGLKGLPAVGYLEQSVADAVAQALVKIGTAKPKFPLLDAPRSALLALALELRAANPRTNGTELGPAYVERKTKYAEACQFVEHARAEVEAGTEWKIKVRIARLEALREGIDGVVSDFR